MFENITVAETSHETWLIFEKIYQRVTKVKKVRLQAVQAEFENLKMNPVENILDYFSRILAIVNQIKSNRAEMPELKVIEKILRSLTLKFEHGICSIEEAKDLINLTVDELMGFLMVYKQRINKNTPTE